MNRYGLSLAFLAVTLVGCEKDATAPKGDLPAQEKELFKSLPSGANLVFGGNYMKVQEFMASSLMQGMTSVMEKASPGMAAWMKCYAEHTPNQLVAAGTARIANSGLELRMIYTGMGLDDLAACAQGAKFPTQIDPDRKFVAITLPPPTNQLSYLVTPSGALYTRQVMTLSATPVGKPVSRADLEADLTAAATSGVLSDAKLAALIDKADHGKTLWFAGTGAGTPIADKLGEFYGTIEFAGGLATDATFQLLDAGLIDKIESSIKQAKQAADRLPEFMKAAVTSLQLSRQGDHLRIAIKLDDKQIGNLMKQIAAFAPRAGATP